MSTHDATFYVQAKPKFFTRYDGSHSVSSITATTITQSRPRHQQPGTVLVKLTLRIPDAAFLPLRPEAIVVVPESMTSAEPIVVEVDDANEDGAR